MQRRLSLSSSSASASPSPARPPSPSHSTNRVTSSFLAPPPLPSLRRSSSRSLLSPLNTSSPSPASAVSSAPPATPSRPIPISPPSAHPSRAHSTPNSLPQAGGSTTTNARRRTHAAALEPYSHRTRRGEEAEMEESEGSFTIPILDTRTLPPLRSSGAPLSSLTTPASGVGAGRGAGGRRLSSLASYTGLPLPPSAGAGGAAGGGGEELRYSLASFRSSLGQAQSQGLGRRPSISGGGGGIVRPPSPAPADFTRGIVGPLTSSVSSGGGGTAGEVKRGRRESVVLGQGSLAALAASGGAVGGRRAPSPARQALSSAQPAASGLVRSSSTSRQNAARSPSPARGDSPRVVRGFDPPQAMSSSSGQRAPSPARFGGGGGAGGSTASAPASSYLSARRASLSSSSSSPLQARPTTFNAPTSPLTRPRSRLANPQSDQHLEVAASRDIAALDAYYYSRKREGREGRREAEERLRVGYDRLQREL